MFDKSLGLAAIGIGLLFTRGAAAASDVCPADPSKWPAPLKPYFMIAFDTSGSMTEKVPGTPTPTNSCDQGTSKLSHGRCAIQKAVMAYSGQVNMGLATFAYVMHHCSDDCSTNCAYENIGTGVYGCGPGTGVTRAGANIVVPIDSDLETHDTSGNGPTLLKWVNSSCVGQMEIFGKDNTPLNGILRDMFRYYAGTWSRPAGTNFLAQSYPSPLKTAAGGERACRSVNVILVTDGEETCDKDRWGNNDHNAAVLAAAALYAGVPTTDFTWKVRTYVIDFASGNTSNQYSDNIAAAGNTTKAYYAADETALSQSLSTIISQALQPETCDNKDNNCNGCVDEGYTHYCNVGNTCCPWGTDKTVRQACIDSYTASITPQNPGGDTTKLPCTTSDDAKVSSTWLCYNPAEPCDNVDNNCNAVVDEGQTKCGDPAHCPTTEKCNGQDDDCDGTVDIAPGLSCSTCVPSSEVCDGCDNDCDGYADNGVGLSVPCGLPTSSTTPSYCSGNQICNSAKVAYPGACTTVSYQACSNKPQDETCDGTDENCNGLIDDGLAPKTCVPADAPGGLVYKDTYAPSQCVKGLQPCNGTCNGFIGPSTEICDGIDNDCDGQTDEGTLSGTGLSCGKNTGECKLGTTVCEGGTIVCKGGTNPTEEICDGKDNNCNGQIDETPLVDAPPSTANGCWTLPGTSCSFENLHWNAPPDADCYSNGNLKAPCAHGTLTCVGGGWICQGDTPPTPEICDGIDNNCDGQADNGTLTDVGKNCGSSSTPPCKLGTTSCTNGTIVCTGNVDPQVEACNGVDDDCSGVIDDHIGWVGSKCGNATPPCAQGTYACVNGRQECQGSVDPKPEVCDGQDNDCDTFVDEAPLSDAPAAGEQGCWNVPGNTCTFKNLSWGLPTGAGCHDVGTLKYPCSAGTLQCSAGTWTCGVSTIPSAEACDGVDNDCNGQVDDVSTVTCTPSGTPTNLVYNDTFAQSQCQRGHQSCGQCAGFVGPSTEVCDNIDNDCDGQVDEDAVGTGVACGATQPPCAPGTMVCANGTLTCQGGQGPQPEVCDGIDNNCNGSVDESPLSDAPAAAQSGCWDVAGTTCTFGNLSWSFPQGASCTDIGNGSDKLAAPCHAGFLVCGGLQGWTCKNAKGPTPEVCDGIDNNCDGTIDEGKLPNTGTDVVCGSNVGECRTGHMECSKGVLTCIGGVQPIDEICDGKDNNCNGVNDDGLPTGGPCSPTYDAATYPGQRTQGACQLGHIECDAKGGTVCVGGIGPQPEVCDGVDNDCDGQVDELGAAPDGIDGSLNPTAGSTAKIGDACGQSGGQCTTGKWTCRYGTFACVGGSAKTQEQCDCVDNDCDGIVDNQADAGPALCGTGKICVNSGGSCFCAPPCLSGEFACAGGQACVTADISPLGSGSAAVCVSQVNLCQGDCSSKTVKDTNGKVLCAPSGTDAPGCQNTPPCKCFPKAGCEDPCYNVQCGAGEVCARFGAKAGQCVTNTCEETGCEGCNVVCRSGQCISNPCTSATCPSDQTCHPSADLSTYSCKPSCAGVSCGLNEVCKDGSCVGNCGAACSTLQVCDTSTQKCVTNQCLATGKTCGPNQCCDAMTGECGQCACDGVVCPNGQSCLNGQCVGKGNPSAGGAGSTNDGGVSGNQNVAGTSTVINPGSDHRAFGRPTGGCGCRVGRNSRGVNAAGLLAASLAITLWRRKRRKSARSNEAGGAL